MARPREFDETAALMRRSTASGVTVTRRTWCATSRRRWASPAPASTTRSATSGRCSAKPSSAMRSARPANASRGWSSTMPPKHAVGAFLGEIVERSLDDRDRRGVPLGQFRAGGGAARPGARGRGRGPPRRDRGVFPPGGDRRASRRVGSARPRSG